MALRETMIRKNQNKIRNVQLKTLDHKSEVWFGKYGNLPLLSQNPQNTLVHFVAIIISFYFNFTHK
jgi:hypothetical protein